MSVICDGCGHLYDDSKDGQTDPLCTASPPGTLRPLTTPERIWIDNYRDLKELFDQSADELARWSFWEGVLLP